MRRTSCLSLKHHLVAGERKDEGLDGNQYDRKVKSRLGLFTDGAKVRLHLHRDRLPLATPTLYRVDGGGGIDGIEEDHGDHDCHEADEGSRKGERCVKRRAVAEL